MYVWNFIYLVVGFSCFYLGRYFHLVWLSRFGHKCVAIGDSSNFGAHKNWLLRNCLGGCCSCCRLWTCAGKGNKE